MPRKPFEALGPHNLVCDCHAKADAAIAQDREYALRRIREENHEGMIYYRERDQARAERDALREENERVNADYREAKEDYEEAEAELVEAVKEIERLKSELASR